MMRQRENTRNSPSRMPPDHSMVFKCQTGEIYDDRARTAKRKTEVSNLNDRNWVDCIQLRNPRIQRNHDRRENGKSSTNLTKRQTTNVDAMRKESICRLMTHAQNHLFHAVNSWDHRICHLNANQNHSQKQRKWMPSLFCYRKTRQSRFFILQQFDLQLESMTAKKSRTKKISQSFFSVEKFFSSRKFNALFAAFSSHFFNQLLFEWPIENDSILNWF